MISIHPPREGRDGFPGFPHSGTRISIHPPRGGRDTDRVLFWLCRRDFNPSSPWGEGRPAQALRYAGVPISIHPPRGGGDTDRVLFWLCRRDFNPPSPWGEGHDRARLINSSVPFQSTLPARGGTGGFLLSSVVFEISIHPPHVGRDWLGLRLTSWRRYFNPPSPWGEGLYYPLAGVNLCGISIHPPREGRDLPDESWQTAC